MLTLNHFVRRRQDVEPEAFRDFWLGPHAAARARLATRVGARRFLSNETLPTDAATVTLRTVYETSSDAYDFADQLIIPDFALFQRAVAEPEICAEIVALHDSEADFVDHRRSNYWFTTEIPQIFPREQQPATWSSTMLKGLYVINRQPHLTLPEAQLHWHSCHGGMARSFRSMLPFVQYVQAHRVLSPTIDELKRMLGVRFEDDERTLGQAEVWFDRNVLGTLQGPEVERMIRMLVADIALFVESGASFLFAAKEHVFLEREMYDFEPKIPVLFRVE